jgi:hypothetical protein
MVLPSPRASPLMREGSPPSSLPIVRGRVDTTVLGGRQAKADVACRQRLPGQEPSCVACLLHCAEVGRQTGPADLK